MKIDRIETYRRDDSVVLVRVITDQGIEGIGQTSVFGAVQTERVLHEQLAPAFLGQDPWDLEALVSAVVRKFYKLSGSYVVRALCGLDTALWDILGKAAGQPVYKLLGGAVRTEIPVYASSMSRTITPDDEAERLARLVAEQGFGAVKIRVGQEMGRDHDAAPGRTQALIPKLRAALGDDVRIHADANGCYTVGGAIRTGRLLEKYGYGHFEEPCPFPEIENTARVTAALDIDVAMGEHDNSLEQIQRILTGNVADIIQPDVGYVGGISRARRVALMAEAAGKPCTPHCSSRSLLQVFTLHLAAAMPSIHQFQEWSIEDDTPMRGLFGPVPEVSGGVVRLGTEPGWGIELDPDLTRSLTPRVSS